MDWREYIEQRSDVMLGKAVFKGTRLTVQHVLERLGEGATDAELLAAHPRLRKEHVQAAQAYAAASLSNDEIAFVGAGGR